MDSNCSTFAWRVASTSFTKPRDSSQAQKTPISSPTVALENPRKVNFLVSDSTSMKKTAKAKPPTTPIHIFSEPAMWFAIAAPTNSQTNK